MSWVVVPCLLTLRDEFNQVNPGRDKGADGTIGDSSHNSSSDHTPDEDSSALNDHDADSKNEVHALDIDCTGPWPGGWDWFDATIKAIAKREKADYEHPTVKGRLQYIIWNRQIISRSWGWSEWRPYTGASAHTDHAHFSARYDTAAESRTDPWGVYEEESQMELDDKFFPGSPSKSWTDRYPGSTSPTVRDAMAFAAYDATDAEKAVGAVAGSVSQLTAKVDAQAGELAELQGSVAGVDAKLTELIELLQQHASGIIEGSGR